MSGGQRKLIAVARVMLQNNKILIFDELTANLDVLNKSLLENNIKLFTENKTVISITHSLDNIFEADRVLLFEDGCIVANGPHKELIKYNGLYQLFFSIFSKTASGLKGL